MHFNTRSGSTIIELSKEETEIIKQKLEEIADNYCCTIDGFNQDEGDKLVCEMAKRI